MEENTLKVTPDKFRAFYWMHGFPVEITTDYELEELERKQSAEVTA